MIDRNSPELENHQLFKSGAGTIISAAMVVTLGIVVLLGWHTHTEILIQVHPALVPMQYNTAFGFLVCGLMLLAQCRGMPRTAIWLAVLATLIGLLTLLEYIAAVDLHIDQLLIQHYITVETSHVGRMAPNTALAFLLTGAVVILSQTLLPKLASAVGGILGSSILALGFAAILGYVLELEPVYRWGRWTGMAVHTACGFMVIGYSLVAIAWRAAQNREKELPPWLPVPATIVLITIIFSIWNAIPAQSDIEVWRNARDFVLIFGLFLAAMIGWAITKLMSEVKMRQQLQLQAIERSKSESKLRESEQRMRLAIEGADLGTWDWCLSNDEVIFNHRFASLLGYRLDELEPTVKTWKNAIHPDDWPNVKEVLNRHLENPDYVYETEHRIRKKSGEWLWILDRGAVIERDADGKPLRMCGTHLDISKSKEATIQLQQFKHIVSNTTDMVALFDTNCVFLATNPKYRESLGMAPGQIVGHSVTEVRGKEFFETMILPHAQHCLAGENIRYQEWFDFPIGGRRYMDISYAPYRNAAGKIVGFVISGRDMTAEAKLQEQLLQSQKMESVGQLAGGLAHDFNNMLGIISGNAELVMDTLHPDDKNYFNLKEIREAAGRSADLTQQLLAFASKQQITPILLNLDEAVGRMLKILRRLIGVNIDLVWEPGLGTSAVKMDRSQLDQLLTNLCINARDAIHSTGKVHIKTSDTDFEQVCCVEYSGMPAGEYVILSVSDNGIGMEKDIADKVFEPFFTTKEMGQGTGLGLAIVYGIVKQNGGCIGLRSEVGKGSTFDIYLPRFPEPVSSVTQDDLPPIVEPGDETILLVDDEPAILRLTTLLLERMGYTVLANSNPDAAIRAAEQYEGKIDLLLSDVIMPGMNGRDLGLHLLTAIPTLKRLFMSGFTADVITVGHQLDDGCFFIQKPFSKENLSVKVREALAWENEG